MAQEYVKDGFEKSECLNFDELVAKVQTTSRVWKKAFESIARSDLTELKSNKEAKELRFRGNGFYGKDADREAIDLYTESVAVAPDKSEELALAYANRSASLLRLGKFVECILDINRALEGNCPGNIRVKLQERKQECLKRMRANNQQSVADQIENQTDPIMHRATNFELDALLDSMCKFGNASIPRASPKIKLEYDEQWGRHIVATEDIEMGEILSRKEFFLMAVKPETLYKNCSYCLVRCYTLIPCSSCTAMYCSKKCLSQASETYHEMECRIVKMNEKPLKKISATVLFLAWRALLIGTKQGTELRSLMAELNITDIFAEKMDSIGSLFLNDYLAVLNMRRTFTSPKDANIMLVVRTIVQARSLGFFDNTANANDDRYHDATSENGDLNEMELFATMLLLNHMSTFSTYAFDIAQFTDWFSVDCGCEKSVGVGFNILHNFVNHSCDPNVQHLMVKNREQILYAKRPIKKGEQIFISYTSDFFLMSLEDRRSDILARHHFTCQCEACTNNWPLFGTLLKCKARNYFNEKLATLDFKEQLQPVLVEMSNRFDADLSNYEILQIARKMGQWINTHVKRPSLLSVTFESQLNILMKLLFEESSREYMSATEIKTVLSIAITQLYNFLQIS